LNFHIRTLCMQLLLLVYKIAGLSSSRWSLAKSAFLFSFFLVSPCWSTWLSSFVENMLLSYKIYFKSRASFSTMHGRLFGNGINSDFVHLVTIHAYSIFDKIVSVCQMRFNFTGLCSIHVPPIKEYSTFHNWI